MTIKFGEVMIGNKAKDNILDCIRRNHVTMGPMCKELENKWAKKFGYKSVKAVNSGTSACMAALMALYEYGAKPGDEVICPALSFIATANAIRAAGFIPKFCDVSIETLVIDESLIESLITDKTIAIMPVTLMGNVPNMIRIRELANKYNLKIVIDNCEAHGARYDNEYMSYYGDFVCYSCYAAHILFAGEFGFVGCKTEKDGEIIESIRSHGRPVGSLYFNHERYGLNLKPTDLNAAIGLESFELFDHIFSQRRLNQIYLTNHLKHLSDEIDFLYYHDLVKPSPHAFSMVMKPNASITISQMQERLDKYGVEWKRNFGSMPTQHKCFEYLGYKYGDFPEAEYVGSNGLHIGCHQYLTMNELNTIVKAVDYRA